MARSIDPAPKAVRGFVPARNDEERYLMRHIEDLARTASSRGIARYSGFLSDREQQLAQAALNRTDMPEDEIRFDGGWPGAERKLLCLEPVDSYPASPLCCVRLQCRALPGAQLPVHKDYLGSLMGLELRREALGDIVLPEDQLGVAYVFATPTSRQKCSRWKRFRRSRRQSGPARRRQSHPCGWTRCSLPCCGAAVEWRQSWSRPDGWRSTICLPRVSMPRCTRTMCSQCAARAAFS